MNNCSEVYAEMLGAASPATFTNAGLRAIARGWVVLGEWVNLDVFVQWGCVHMNKSRFRMRDRIWRQAPQFSASR